MYKNLFLGLSLLLCLGACKTSKQTTATTNDPVIQTIGDKPVHASEFAYVYKKNNSNAENAYSSQSVKEYLDLYTNFRLKVREAESLGLDTAESFKSELQGYKKQLAQPYLTEKAVTEQLAKEAYTRMGEEVNASHILINVNHDAEPKDTLEAFNKITDIRNRATKGESFETLAETHSQDPSAKSNKGNLGYFSALQMVYPFENAAYSTPKGQVSTPVRTRFGYHILKVNDRRKSQGQVRVAHIMIRATQGMPESDSLAAKQRIEDIYSRLQKGESWKQLTDLYSEDANSKPKGGELPWFTTGRMIPSFEEAAFALTDTGMYSKPIQTPYGWHVIKLLERKGLEPYSELEQSLKTKVSKDSRSELNKTALLQRIKKENNFVEYPLAVEAAVNMADTTLTNGTWDKKVESSKNLPLFNLGATKYTTNDFFQYLLSFERGKEKPSSPAQYMRYAYRTYQEEQLVNYEESHLEEKHYDYKMLVKEYRDGILLFQLMDEKVWSKAINDTVGLKKFFEQNQQKYKWNNRAHATIYNASNNEVLTKLKSELKKERYPVNNVTLGSSVFDAGQKDLSDKGKQAADDAAARLKRDKNYLIELGGSSDVKEATGKNANISLARAQAVRKYLISKGIDSTRIIVKDLGKQKPSKDKEEQRVVSYSAYSKSGKALENMFNETAPLTLQVTDGVFQKGENEILDQVEWKTGEQTLNKNGRIYYVVISKIDEPRLKTFEEARGITISEYQNHLEQEWIKSLKQKYPVVTKQEEVDKLISKK